MLTRLKHLVMGLGLRRSVLRAREQARKAHAADPVRSLLHELCVEADERGIEALTARQRLVVRTWSALGIIGNGGFRYFLEGTAPLPAVADGFRALGFDGAAAACERVATAVAAAPGLTDEARRQAVRATSDHRTFRDEERAIYAVSWDALGAAIGDFMRRHPRDFPGLG